jgi:hypothetical protein
MGAIYFVLCSLILMSLRKGVTDKSRLKFRGVLHISNNISTSILYLLASKLTNLMQKFVWWTARILTEYWLLCEFSWLI